MYLETIIALFEFTNSVSLFLGYVAYNFVMGAYSYWGPKAGYSIYQMVKSLYPFTLSPTSFRC